MKRSTIGVWILAVAIGAVAFGAAALAADSTSPDKKTLPDKKLDVSAVPDELTVSTSEKLWKEFVASPYTHPNIPNVSFAGYQFSERPIPSPEVVANVKE